MVGKRQFDERAVLDRATEVFWRRGYNGTSVDHLVDATGLGRGSLYGAFGSKPELFGRVVDHYRARVAAAPGPTTDREVGEAVRVYLGAIADRSTSGRQPPGCLITHSCADLDNIPDSVRGQVRAGLDEEIQRMRDFLTEAQDDGRLAPAAEVDELARYFVAIRQSLAVLAASGASRQVLHQIIEVSTRSWPGSPRQEAEPTL